MGYRLPGQLSVADGRRVRISRGGRGGSFAVVLGATGSNTGSVLLDRAAPAGLLDGASASWRPSTVRARVRLDDLGGDAVQRTLAAIAQRTRSLAPGAGVSAAVSEH